VALPFVMVNPEMVTVLPEAMWNKRLMALPFTARLAAPGPEMVMLSFTMSSPVVNTIVPVTAKVIVSASFAMARAWRNEPGPLSFVFVTVIGVLVAVAVGVGVGVGPDCAQYLPPVFK
jgi:hypothetical protein